MSEPWDDAVGGCWVWWEGGGGRLVDRKAPAVTVYGTDVLDKGQIWSPRLTFANRRSAQLSGLSCERGASRSAT